MAKTASLNPETFLEGGGLIDDVDVEIKSAKFVMFDYNGTVVPGVPSLEITFDADGQEFVENYSMGKADDWVPSDDGAQLVAVGTSTSIRMSTNGGIFLKHLVEAGYPAENLDDSIAVLEGLKAHVIRVPEPERKNVVKSKKKQEREAKYGPDTIVVVSGILELPGEAKPKGKAIGKAKAKTTTTKATAKAEAKAPVAGGDDDALADKATEAIMELLAAGDPIDQKKLPMALFAALKTDPDRNGIMQLAVKPAFLEAGPWVFEDGTLSMG